MKFGLMLLSVLLSSGVSAATISSDWVKVKSVRAIVDGNVYLETESIAMCETDTFLLKVDSELASASYAALLAAATSGKDVKLQTWKTCAENDGWGTEVQAITVQFF